MKDYRYHPKYGRVQFVRHLSDDKFCFVEGGKCPRKTLTKVVTDDLSIYPPASIVVRGRIIKATMSNAPCTDACKLAVGMVCICSCGGHNHGINLGVD